MDNKGQNILECFENVAIKAYFGNEDIQHKFSDIKSMDCEHPVLCPDQFVALIEITNAKVSFIEQAIVTNKKDKTKARNDFHQKIKKEIDSKSKKYKIIAMVLESPHKEEYSGNKPIGPAIGTTGKNIYKYTLGNIAKYIQIEDTLSSGAIYKSYSKISNGIYALLLINAIQYPCSLKLKLSNKKNIIIRNKIFKDFFGKCKNTDFLPRLKQYNPDIIINACTGQSSSNITEMLKNNFNNTVLLETSHPSSPYFCAGFLDV